MWYDPRDLIGAQALPLQNCSCALFHGTDSQFENLVPLHLKKVLSGSYRFKARRLRTASCGQVKYFVIGAVRAEESVQNAVAGRVEFA